MSADGTTRREVLKQSLAAAGALGGAMAMGGCGPDKPVMAAAAAQRVPGANERIRIGMIGVGGRGSSLMGQIIKLAEAQNVEVAAVCDVWKVNLDAAAAKVEEAFGKPPQKSTRFGDLLANDKLHAVVIATPDFAHTPIMIEALEAAKDVYVEKPMSIELENANTALDLARANKRVVQVGTQRRSDGNFKAAAKEVGTGVLGQITRVSACVNFNHPRWLRNYDNCKAADVDWDAYLFNRPKVEFDPRLLRRWHLFKEFTNGLSGLWMAHYSDALHMITGAEYPDCAVTLGDTYVWKEDREHSDVFHTLMKYPEGFMWDWEMSLTNGAYTRFDFHGTKGTFNQQKMTLLPDGGAGDDRITEARKIEPEPHEDHMGNWLKCLRTRERPNADIQYGHQHAVATILAAKALHTGKRLAYDPKKREIHEG